MFGLTGPATIASHTFNAQSISPDLQNPVLEDANLTRAIKIEKYQGGAGDVEDEQLVGEEKVASSSSPVQ
ncbi:hypothetical protein E2562_000487 [Oryza meyeriana var. granulata]|uniref:Uncharacterized protein n=1 Tax=Oryza meyeriana var. granulata TaxID=110450 RepID=A0A6G1CCC1_9ORYZ|nr:hypothetical protein E2562_000487 [Oryza meyeriana var. granulata]